MSDDERSGLEDDAGGMNRSSLLKRIALGGAALSIPTLAGVEGALAATNGAASAYPKHPKWRFVFVNHVTTNPFFVPTQYGADDACTLVAPDLALLHVEPVRLAGCELAALKPSMDPVMLAVLAPVDDRRGSLGRSGSECGSSNHRNGQERDLSHGYVSLSNKRESYGSVIVCASDRSDAGCHGGFTLFDGVPEQPSQQERPQQRVNDCRELHLACEAEILGAVGDEE